MQRLQHSAPLPPPEEGEIELSSGNAGEHPIRVTADHPCATVRKFYHATVAATDTIAKEKAQVAESKAAALMIVEAYHEMLNQKNSIAELVARAEGGIEKISARMAKLEGEVRHYWHQREMHDHHIEWARLDFLLTRLPGYLDGYRKDLAAIEAKIAAFEKANKIEIADD